MLFCFIYYFFMLMFIFFFFNFLYRNIFFWWRIFVLITLTFIFLIKVEGSFSSSLNYFLVQEFIGLIFLVFTGSFLQFLVLILKIGIAPFHFWVFSVVSSLKGYLLIWFLTFQKIPFVPVLVYLFSFFWLFLVLFGLFTCYLQIFVLKNLNFLYLISSTESFNWIFVGLFFGIWGFTLLFFYYFFNIVFLITFVSNFYSQSFLNLETFLVFLNLPLTVSFFIKVFILSISLIIYDFYFLILLVIIFFSSIALVSWFISFSLFSFKLIEEKFGYTFFILYVVFFIFFF